MRRFDTDVLVIGAGPVGLCLASDLAWRGTACILVERRTERTGHPKATLLGARAMEQLRRWNLEDEIYASCLPNENDYFIRYVTRMNGRELIRFTSPSIDKVRSRDPGLQQRWPELGWSPYGKTQIGQQAVEPILVRTARSFPGLDFREGWKFVGLEQDREGVTATLEHEGDGRRRQVAARYMVGCDGGGSRVRRALGIDYVGRGAMRSNVSFLFRSAEFAHRHPMGPGNLFYILAPGMFGVFMAIDGKDLWSFQYYFVDPAKDEAAIDPKTVLQAAYGAPFELEVLQTTHWQHHQSVAARFRQGRVYLAGDSAHLFCPTGGVGMNTGINDAFDLSWKLDATLRGWGGDWLLASYEEERRPVAIRNTQRAADNSDKNDMIMAEATAELEEDTPRAELLRGELSRKLAWVARQFDSAGVHLGYRYSGSPLCTPDGTMEPPDDFRVVVQTTFPGSRAPHAWLADGSSTLDLFGRDTVLVCTGGATGEEGAPMMRALAARGIPSEAAVLDDPAVASLYERRFVLVRPDGHVAWRGDAMPPDPEEVVDRMRGALRPRFVPETATELDLAFL